MRLLDVLVDADLTYVPLWACVYLVAQILGTFKIYLLFRPVARIPYATLLRYDIVATAIGYFTPGQVGGPITLAFFLRENDLRISKSASVLILDKVVTLAVTIVLGGIGVWYVLHLAGGATNQDLYFRGGGALATTGLLFGGLFSVQAKRLGGRLATSIKTFFIDVSVYRKHWTYLLANAAIALVLQANAALTWVVSLRAIGRIVPYLGMFLTAPALAVIGYVPVSIAGLGTQELGAIALWKPLGLTSADALSAYIFARTLMYLVAIGTLIVYSVLRKKRPSVASGAL